MNYGENACIAKALRDTVNYDSYSERINIFSRKIRESALLKEEALLIPYAQHSGLATKLLDITSNPLVALYFACQPTNDTSDGYIYIFDDYANATNLLEKYPKFDLEKVFLNYVTFLYENKQKLTNQSEKNYLISDHNEIKEFGKCIDNYRKKYSNKDFAQNDSPFTNKLKKLRLFMDEIKLWIISICSDNKEMASFLLPENYQENTPAIKFIHPYKEECYEYCEQQYQIFKHEIREYLVSLECIIAFINDKSPIVNLEVLHSFDHIIINFLPNLLFRPVMTFKRGLSQQGAFFLQTAFNKHESSFINTNNEEEKKFLDNYLNVKQIILKVLLLMGNQKKKFFMS
ncbi:FRG domain-containing protein [Enterococcus faecium]|nr:FRG domain-containing protein [Enterococcus faecium]EME7121627.1 FRG domain-containing protein [Enterococcus faecium]EME8145435.1 FRG domain-containing protein [Enterococcus faecium]EMF0403731.1 FRG domain-containing protein [Enterococcus faecium]EMF0636019.1 FRG domain-containing protein [Enterococcus faecium]